MLFAYDPLADPEPLIRRVYAYVARRIGHGPDAEDVTSEVFERAVRHRASYDSGRGKAIMWLIGIARRAVDDHLRNASEAARHHASEELGHLIPDGEWDFGEASLRKLTVSAAVAELCERDRELIALRYGADLTARQIADHLDLKTNAVEVALHRALGRLRTLLEPDGMPAVERAASR